MDLQTVERQQTGLVQFLIVAIMLILGAITVLAFQYGSGPAIPVLSLAALCTCLYATVQERRLRRLHSSLEDSLDTKSRVMDRMGDRIREENARSQELGTRLDDLTRLYRAISAVNAVSDPASAYDVVVRAAIQLVNADTGSLMLVEGGGKTLALRSAVGLPDAVLANHVSRQVGEGVAGWVAQNAQPLLLTGEAENDPRFTNTISDTGIECSLCVPLVHAHRVLGVLSLGVNQSEERHAENRQGEDSPNGDARGDEESPGRKLGESEQSLANIFAQHAAVTVMNSRLLEVRAR